MGSVHRLAVPLLLLCWEALVPAGPAGPSARGPLPSVTTDSTEVPTVTQGVGTGSEGAFRTPSLAETTASGCDALETQKLGTETFAKGSTPAGLISETETSETQAGPHMIESWGTQMTSPTTETPDSQTTSPDMKTRETQTTFSATAALDTQTTSAAESWDPQTTFPSTETRHMQTTSSATETRDPQTTSFATETRTLTKITLSKFMETPAPSNSPTRTGQTAAETGPRSMPTKAIFDPLWTEDSSEEINRMTVDILVLEFVSTEAKRLSSESSSSSDSSASEALATDITTPARGDYSATHWELLTETAVTGSRTSHTGHIPTGGTETSVLSTRPTASAERLPTASASESAAPDTTLLATRPESTETRTPAASSPTHTGTSVTVGRDTSALVQQSSPVASGAEVVVPTVCSGAASAVSSPSGYCSSEGTTAKTSTLPGNATTQRVVPVSRSAPSPVPLMTTKVGQATSVASAKATATPETPTAASTSVSTRQTTGREGGFLLVRLSVASLDDLTEPTAAERLVRQVRCKLHHHVPLARISLLNVRRS